MVTVASPHDPVRLLVVDAALRLVVEPDRSAELGCHVPEVTKRRRQVADLDLSLIENSTGRRWIRTRRPELYRDLAVPTGQEVDTRALRFDEKGV